MVTPFKEINSNLDDLFIYLPLSSTSLILLPRLFLSLFSPLFLLSLSLREYVVFIHNVNMAC